VSCAQRSTIRLKTIALVGSSGRAAAPSASPLAARPEMSQMSQIGSLYRALYRRSANFYFSKLRLAVVWLGQIQNLDTAHVRVLGLESGSERLKRLVSTRVFT